jgi:hypothetical protein
MTRRTAAASLGRRLALAVAATWLSLAPVHAQDVLGLYDLASLSQAAKTYTPNLRGMWQEDFLARLSKAERRRAGDVVLDVPLWGQGRSPLTFYALVSQRRVVIPIASIKFLDDLAVAFSYYQAHRCDMGLVSDYVAALRVQSPQPAGAPLDVLGVPASALQDEWVNDVAMKALKSNVFFVLAHEFAHVMYRHQGYAQLTARQAQDQEMAADDFALDVMRRIGVAPIAGGQFFLLTSRLERPPADFHDPAAYAAYQQEQMTHPLSTARLDNLAAGIEAHVAEFARSEPHPEAVAAMLGQAASQLRAIARTLDEHPMRDFLDRQARNLDVRTLRTACGE